MPWRNQGGLVCTPRFIHSTRRWSRLAGNIQVLALPFSTQIPDRVVSHTFVQPIDCLMSNPRPGDTNWIPETSGWRESASTPPLTCLVPVPGCLLGSEPATCPRTPPAGRKFTPASTSETGRKSSAGPETPPLVHLLPVGPVTLPVSDHELRASCMGVKHACATAADTAEDEKNGANTCRYTGHSRQTCTCNSSNTPT